MVFVPVLARSVIEGRVTVSLGDALLDEYVEFVGAEPVKSGVPGLVFMLSVWSAC